MPSIACTLDAAQRPQRETDVRSVGRDGLLSVERGERRVVLRFRRDPDIRKRVEYIAAAESKCCAFLGFDVAEEDQAIALTVSAPDGGEAIMRELVSLFAGDTPLRGAD